MRDTTAGRELLEREMLANPVMSLQYMLRQLSQTYQFLPQLAVDGVFGERTLEAVMSFQREAGLPVTGTVDRATWEALYRMYAGITDTMAEYTNVVPEPYRPDIDDTLPNSVTQFPGRSLSLGDSDTMGGRLS